MDVCKCYSPVSRPSSLVKNGDDESPMPLVLSYWPSLGSVEDNWLHGPAIIDMNRGPEQRVHVGFGSGAGQRKEQSVHSYHMTWSLPPSGSLAHLLTDDSMVVSFVLLHFQHILANVLLKPFCSVKSISHRAEQCFNLRMLNE